MGRIITTFGGSVGHTQHWATRLKEDIHTPPKIEIR
jgi:hypothetical protein